jgi:sialate O-acetylesterase
MIKHDIHYWRLFFGAGMAFVFAWTCPAEVVPAALFTDHAVLQRDMPLPVWGRANPRDAVRVEFAGQAQETRADASGRWLVRLGPVSDTGPHIMKIIGPDNTVTISDVLAGEVWLCSGQSNMRFPLSKSAGGREAAAAAGNPQLRLFDVPLVPSQQPARDVAGAWKRCEPATAENFSAVAYYFGAQLQKALGCPVGLVHSSWGGTVAKSWMPLEALRADPRFDVMMEREQERLEKLPETKKKYERDRAAWVKRREKNPATAGPAPVFHDAASKAAPAHLYNGMIHPLIPYAMRGVAWYQGESNRTSPAQYGIHLPELIKSWRRVWGQSDPRHGAAYPFLIVQIANYLERKDDPNLRSPWAEIREVQRLTALGVPNTALVVTIDLGEADNIHPANKLDVGKRLALAAERLAYGHDVAASSPSVRDVKWTASEVTVSFANAEGGLVSHGALTGFAVAGSNGKFFNAEAVLSDDTVVVSCKHVRKPDRVRYLWADNPRASLYNKQGLPASPFEIRR